MQGSSKRHSLSLAIALALASLCPAPAANAASRTWVGSPILNGNWSSEQFLTTNWDGFIPPVNGDSLVFAGGSRLSNTNDLLTTIADLSFATGAGPFVLGGNALIVTGSVVNHASQMQTVAMPLLVGTTGTVWSGGSGGLSLRGGLALGNRTLELTRRVAVAADSMVVAHGGSAALTLSESSRLSSTFATLASGSSSDVGSVTVTGAGSSWTTTKQLTVGQRGHGRLSVLNGAAGGAHELLVGSAASSTGLVTVSGTGSQFSASGVLGGSGRGALEVRSGGKFTGALFVADQAGSSGSVLVDGADSLFSGSIVGIRGAVALRVQNGGRFIGDLRTAFVGQGAGYAALVDGPGSLVEARKVDIAFATGTTRFDIHRGGVFRSTGFYLDSEVSEISVVGTGSLLHVPGEVTANPHSFDVKAGRMDVLQGGVVRTHQALTGQQVVIDGAGSLWANEEYLTISTPTTAAASMEIRNGGRVTTGRAYVGGYRYGFMASYPGDSGSPGRGTLNVTGPGSRWESGVLFVGSLGEGSLNVTAGATVVASVHAGLYEDHKDLTPKSDGWVVVSGIGSSLSGYLGIAHGGRADLKITDGGKASGGLLGIALGRGIGKVTIDGAGSSWTGTGESSYIQMNEYGPGNASLQLLNGGKATATKADVGVSGTAYVLVDGPGSALALTGPLELATSMGQGTVEVRRGGTLASGSAAIGASATELDHAPHLYGTGTVIVDGAGSAWNVAGTVSVGAPGKGRLQLSNGSRLSAGEVRVGKHGRVELAGGNLASQALVLDGGSVTTTGVLQLQDTGPLSGHGQVNGRLHAGSRAITASGGTLMLGDAAMTGAVVLGAGRLDAGSQQLVLRSADAVALGDRTTVAAGGRLTAANGLLLAAGGRLEASGGAAVEGAFVNEGHVGSAGGMLRFADAVSGTGSFAGGVRFDAAHAPGDGAARVDFGGGSVTYGSGAVLTMEVFGAGAGTAHDQLANIDLLSFNGQLQLVFDRSFAPAAGGSQLQLFSFQRFTGLLDGSHIDVVGFDRSRLDFSLLGQTGSLSIAAPVPEPQVYAMLLAGLGLLGWARHRSRGVPHSGVGAARRHDPAHDLRNLKRCAAYFRTLSRSGGGV